MNYLLFVYLLCRVYYYFGEGATESILWKQAKSHTIAPIYHAWRELVENMGARIMLLIFCILYWKSWGIGIFLFAELVGLMVYELKYRHVKYGNAFHHKDGEYKMKIPFIGTFRMKYPDGEFLVFIGFVSVIFYGLICYVKVVLKW